MANMSYCRFRNTKSDLMDCLYVLEREAILSKDEREAMYAMFREFLEFCENAGIIGGEEDWRERLDEFYESFEENGDDD